MMHPFCEFLLNEESKSCAACSGWFCTSMGRKKKISDDNYCRDYRDECPRYLEIYPRPADERDFLSTNDYKEPVTMLDKVKSAVIVEVNPPQSPQPIPDCPYLGPVPEGRRACCGVWCYANDGSLRTYKHCKSRPTWRECTFRLKAERIGVKHASI